MCRIVCVLKLPSVKMSARVRRVKKDLCVKVFVCKNFTVCELMCHASVCRSHGVLRFTCVNTSACVTRVQGSVCKTVCV